MEKLNFYRRQVDRIDKEIVQLLLLRFRIAKSISQFKKKSKIKIADNKREVQVLNNIGKFSGMHKGFVLSIYRKIIEYSKKLQNENKLR